MSEHPREVRARLARLEEDRKRIAADRERQLKAASDRIKAAQEDRARARAHQIVKQNLNRPL